MQKLQPTYGDIFGEIKIILADLLQTQSYEDLLLKEKQLNILYQKFSFLKISNLINRSSTEAEPLQSSENQLISINSDDINTEEFETHHKPTEFLATESGIKNIPNKESEIEEVYSFREIDIENNSDDNLSPHISQNEMEKQEVITSQQKTSEQSDDLSEKSEEIIYQEGFQELEPMQDSQFSFAMDKEASEVKVDNDYEARLAEKESKLKELEEKRRKIVEFSKDHTKQLEPKKEYESEDHTDKKFRLAHIKGLKITKSLFDDDPLEKEYKHPEKESGSLLKNNVPTDYMEAPKQKPEFKLDLNDRLAFSQYLFDGSQSELNEVVTKLNSFNSLEKAQEFLSDIYYERDWKKVDNYAQRLWTLVENRFL